MIGDAKHDGIYDYHKRIVTKLEQDFVSYHAENSNFMVSELLNLLVAFNRVSDVENTHKLLTKIVEQLPQAIKNSDADMLKLFRMFESLGLL